MASLEALTKEVIVVTNRPDLVADTELAIRHSILFYHHLDFFWRDKQSAIINVTSGPSIRHEIPLSRLGAMRAIDSVSPFFPGSECCGKPLTRQQRLGQCECEFWMLGPMGLVIKSTANTHQFQIRFWQNPVLTPAAAFSSWVADLYPDAVIDAACAKLFEEIRDSTTADRYRARVGKRMDAAGAATGHCHRILSEQLEQDIRSY